MNALRGCGVSSFGFSVVINKIVMQHFGGPALVLDVFIFIYFSCTECVFHTHEMLQLPCAWIRVWKNVAIKMANVSFFCFSSFFFLFRNSNNLWFPRYACSIIKMNLVQCVVDTACLCHSIYIFNCCCGVCGPLSSDVIAELYERSSAHKFA